MSVDLDEAIDFIKSDGLCNWMAGDNCGPVEKAMVSVMNNILPLCLELKALREVEKAARKIKCYADTDCMCIGITEVDEALEKLDEVRRG